MKIMLMGPSWRNENLALWLTARGHSVLMDDGRKEDRYFSQINPDYIISNGYGPIFSKFVCQSFYARIINIHPAALPWGRGIYPNVWALYEGHPIGVSVHLIDPGIDTGKLLDVEFMPGWEREWRLANPAETLQTFYSHLLRRAEQLFQRTWERVEACDCQPFDQEPLGHDPYKNRAQSEELMRQFPDRWDTPIALVKLAGENLNDW
jgi:methionyl-tRNA formyltransferase